MRFSFSRLIPALALAVAGFGFVTPAHAATSHAVNLASDEEVLRINWDDLLPEGEMERIEELYRLSYGLQTMDHFGAPMTQIGTFNVVRELIGQTIRMPGYILPLNAQPGGEISEFLLVPYFGACVHTPPPPPNQIVYVVMDEPITVERVWAPIWVTGVLTAERADNDLGDAAYTLQLTDFEPYERRQD